MTTTEYLAAHGPHKTARAIVNNRLVRVCGMGIDDLADNCEMADLVEEVAGCLENGDIKEALQIAKETVTFEFVEENVFG